MNKTEFTRKKNLAFKKIRMKKLIIILLIFFGQISYSQITLDESVNKKSNISDVIDFRTLELYSRLSSIELYKKMYNTNEFTPSGTKQYMNGNEMVEEMQYKKIIDDAIILLVKKTIGNPMTSKRTFITQISFMDTQLYKNILNEVENYGLNFYAKDESGVMFESNNYFVLFKKSIIKSEIMYTISVIR